MHMSLSATRSRSIQVSLDFTACECTLYMNMNSDGEPRKYRLTQLLLKIWFSNFSWWNYLILTHLCNTVVHIFEFHVSMFSMFYMYIIIMYIVCIM